MALDQRYHGARIALLGLLAGTAVQGWRGLRPFVAAVQGASMAPTLEDEDLILAVRRDRLTRGSVVVLEHPERAGFELIKRVRGLPGDQIEDRRLVPGQVWVEGDAPMASSDSRSFGPVPSAAIRGVVILRYWPPHRIGRIR